jgi:hypothetical protein
MDVSGGGLLSLLALLSAALPQAGKTTAAH